MVWTNVGTITLSGDFQPLGSQVQLAWGLTPTSFRGQSSVLPFAPTVFIKQSFDFPSTGYTVVHQLQLSAGSDGRSFGDRTFFGYLDPVSVSVNHMAYVAGGFFSGLSCTVWAFIR